MIHSAETNDGHEVIHGVSKIENTQTPLEKYSIKYTTSIHSNMNNMKTCDVTEYEEICRHNSCHESISDIKPVKLFYDIELEARDFIGLSHGFKDITPDLISIVKQLLTNVLTDLYPYKRPPTFVVKTATHPHYMDCKTHTYKWKMSFHIIVSNFCMLKHQQEYFTKYLNKVLRTNDETYKLSLLLPYCRRTYRLLDDTLYHFFSKMRSVYCTKEGENRPSVLLEGSFYDSIINYVTDDCQVIQLLPIAF